MFNESEVQLVGYWLYTRRREANRWREEKGISGRRVKDVCGPLTLVGRQGAGRTVGAGSQEGDGM